MTSILEGQPPKTKPFSNQNKGHLGSRYIYVYIYTNNYMEMYESYQHIPKTGVAKLLNLAK